MFNQNTDILIGDKLLRIDSLLTKQKTGRFELYDFGSIFQSLVKNSQIGVDVAPLVSGLIPQAYLPSYVDDVLEYANILAFPATGETGKIYVDLSTGEIYRWSGSVYVEISKTATWGLIGGSLSSQTDLVNALNAKQNILISGTNLKTVNGSSLLGSGNLQVGTILGTLPATVGLIPIANGTSNTITTTTALSFISNQLNIGTATPLVAVDLNISRALAGTSAPVGISITNPNTAGLTGINLGESLTNRLAFAKFGSTASAGTINGTSLALQNSSYIFSAGTGGIGGAPLYFSGLPIVFTTGILSTNSSVRTDVIGLRIDANNNSNTTNLNRFTVNGNTYLGGNSTATALLHIAPSTTSFASFRMDAGTPPLSPNSGDLWSNGGFINYRIGGITRNLAYKAGWGVYIDTNYTAGSPFLANQSASYIALPNNKGNVIETYLPSGVTTFYDGTKITPKNIGDYYSISIRFDAKNSSSTGYFSIGIDLGGSIGIAFKETLVFAKGANTEQSFSITVPAYSLGTFISNGGIIKILAEQGNASIYNILYHVTQIHSAL